MASSFRKLRAYELAAGVGDQIHRDVVSWPAFDRWSLGIQLVRAADSIGANIAEAVGRWHPADKRRLFTIARGSLYETEHWLLRANNRGLPTGGALDQLDEVARALSGLINRPVPE